VIKFRGFYTGRLKMELLIGHKKFGWSTEKRLPDQVRGEYASGYFQTTNRFLSCCI